jgi:hypothetical protein
MNKTSFSPKNNGPLFVIIIGVVIILAGIISFLYLNKKNSANNYTPPYSTSTILKTQHYESKNLKLAFDFPSTFNLIPESSVNSKVSLLSKYFVKVDFIGTHSNETALVAEPSFETPPHYFGITFENKPVPLVEAMKQDNQFFADTFNDLMLHKKPKTDLMEVSEIDGKTVYIFTLGAEGINSKYVYIQRSTMDTTVIKLTYIGDVLKESIQPSPISEALQLEIFKNLLTSLKLS